MLKFIGSFAVIAATTLLGMNKAAGFRERYRKLEQLRQIICRIQSEVRYARSTMEEICRSAAASAKEPYSTWLASLAADMHKREGETFAYLWETSVKECLGTSGLPDEELLRLGELGEQLGSADVQMQIKVLELYLTRLSDVLQESRTEMKTKVRLYHCLGIMSGMLIVTLLV